MHVPIHSRDETTTQKKARTRYREVEHASHAIILREDQEVTDGKPPRTKSPALETGLRGIDL